MQRVGVVAGPLALAAFLITPAPAPINDLGMARCGLLAFAVVWWITAPVPLAVTTLAALGAGVMLGALTLDEAFAGPTSWVLWFAVGAFGLGAALEATGFNRRFALAFLGSTWVRAQPHRFLFMFLLSATIMSGLMANTVVAVVWLSLAMTIYGVLGVKKGDSLAELNTLGIAWAANIGGVTTPVGTATNPVAIGMIAAATGVTITFLQWTIIGSCLAALFVASTFVVLRYLTVPDTSAFARPETIAFIDAERRRLGPMPAAERRALCWMGVAIGLWLVPDLARILAPPETAAMLGRQFGLVVPALLVPTAMCLTPAGSPDRRFVLTWEEWARGVDWGMVIFIGGVMGLGTAVGADQTGIPEFLQTRLEPSLVNLSEYTFVFALAIVVIVVTSVISNLVSLAIFLPLGLTLSQSLGLGAPAAIGVVLGIGPSLAYLLPSGTTTNAIIAGSGYLRVATMLRLGIVVVILHALLLTFVGYPLAKAVLY